METVEGGLDHVKAVVVDDSLGLAADFEADMARHVSGYQCEWKGVLDDPDKLARFTSFVNAPGVPDPTISFGESHGRKVPVLLGQPTVRSSR
jgi:nitrite reductase (NADH) large subunit